MHSAAAPPSADLVVRRLAGTFMIKNRHAHQLSSSRRALLMKPTLDRRPIQARGHPFCEDALQSGIAGQ